MDSRQFAITSAHAVASEFVRLGIVVPDKEVVSTAIVEDAGLRVVVSVTRYDGPARLYPTPEGAAALGVPMIPSTLTPIQKRVLDVLDTTPKKGSWIAAKIGVKYDGNFRAMLAKMVKLKLIEKRNGYAKPST